LTVLDLGLQLDRIFNYKGVEGCLLAKICNDGKCTHRNVRSNKVIVLSKWFV